MKRFLVSLVVVIAAASVFAQQPIAPREPAPVDTISVTGTGHVSLTPDRYSFTATVQTMAPTVEEAVNDNNQKVAAAIAALKAAGAKAEEIQTSNFSIFPQQDYSQQQQGKPPRVIGYQVSNSVTVTRKQVSDAGRLLQAAISAGVNQTSGLTFSVADPSRGRDDGLRAAFAEAHAKASLFATAAGRTLGPAIAISEIGAMQPQPRPMMARNVMAAQAVSAEVPVESGSTELTFTVSVVFAMR
jgi:uncharacterized protein YggE